MKTIIPYQTRSHSCLIKILVLLITPLFIPSPGACQSPEGDPETALEEGFVRPPESARPRVWWHWMNGNITQDGIRKDLEWMHRTGIGGFQNFDAAFMTPQIVEERLVYMTDPWKEAFRFTTLLADSLDLEMAIAGSPGWSESGGPWVPPAEAMKKYVWSELVIEGGEAFNGILPHPPRATGTFQDLQQERINVPGLGGGGEVPEYYADAAVVAYRMPEADKSLKKLRPKITSSGGTFTLDMLTDGDLVTTSLLPAADSGELAWIQFEFRRPQTIHSVSMVGGGNPGRFGFGADRAIRTLEKSEDGNTFEKVTDIPAGRIAQNTLTFQPVTARYFRVSVIEPPPVTNPGFPGLFGDMPGANRAPEGTEIAEIVLYSTPRIHRFEEKAGFATIMDVQGAQTPGSTPEVCIRLEDVMDLSTRMQPDGSLEWTPANGSWRILRIGYTLTGHQNGPASPEATGLEVDKLNPEYVRRYFNNYLDQYQDATGGLMGERGLQYVITDSWEAGTANWTNRMIIEFNKRNSYNILPWLPVLTGKIVVSSEASEKFLWDFRNTLEEMVAEFHYDELSSILKEREMGRYTESHEGGRAFIGDGMEVKRSADIPMSATWTPGGFGRSEEYGVDVRHEADIRESASVAHIYGQNLVAAESLTAIGNSFAYAPERLKPTADIMLASGLNRFVIHTSVHQPVDNKVPGLGLGPFGQWFTRHETWAEQAGPWIDYLTRSSFMLQQGRFVADVLYIYGQGTNITALFGSKLPPVPEGYNFDFLNAAAMIPVLSVEDGKIAAGEVMRYSIMALDESTRYMTLPVLKKIEELVEAGAVVVGPKPLGTPSLNDNAAEFSRIADRLWGNASGIMSHGSGKLYPGSSLGKALRELDLTPDFWYNNEGDENRMRFVHRVLGGTDIYWVNTAEKESATRKVSFRLQGKEPEIWNPVTGKIAPASYAFRDGRTEVTLHMDPEDALFIVFRKGASQASRVVTEPEIADVATLTGDWEVRFQEHRGAPEMTVFGQLTPWIEHEDPGIRYFSGTATYQKNLEIPAEWLTANKELWLDLGEVKNLAEVAINGKSLGIVWKKPFRVRMDPVLVAGENMLTLKVTNLWVNRLIGDRQSGMTEKVTYTTMPFYQADSPLLPSGLLGPVRILGLSSGL
jgi:hypothetical protein